MSGNGYHIKGTKVQVIRGRAAGCIGEVVRSDVGGTYVRLVSGAEIRTAASNVKAAQGEDA